MVQRGATEGTETMAYLGPPGTYGHQAAGAFAQSLNLEQQLDLLPCPDITSIYSHPADYLVMPLQNTIHGGVLETIDTMIAGPSNHTGDQLLPPRIIGELDLPIRHCLVARTGTKTEDICWVRSHEQALGQSALFLAEHLPHAKLQQWPSTAGAAVSLLEGPTGEGPGAAICSKAVVSLYPDQLEVLYEGTQGIDMDNFTRFLLFNRTTELSSEEDQTQRQDASEFYVATDARGIAALASKGLDIKAIHSRPVTTATSTDVTTNGGAHPPSLYPLGYLVETGLCSSKKGKVPGLRYLGRTSVRAVL